MTNITHLDQDEIDAVPKENSVSGTGYIYIIEYPDDTIKIGRTNNLFRRISQHKQASPIAPLRICHSVLCANYGELENQTHLHFRERRIKGEYFRIRFDEAVYFVSGLPFDTDIDSAERRYKECLKLGAQYAKQWYQLPPAMEELKIDAPILHDWMVKSGFEMYWDADAYRVRSADGEVDMSFELFAAITIAGVKGTL